MACTSDQTGRLYVKQHPGDAQLSLDELRDMVGREGQTISNCVFSVSEYQNFPNSYLLFTMVSMHLSISHSLCSAVHNYDSLCRRSSRSPIMLSILLVYLFIYYNNYIYIYIYIYPCRTSCPKSSTCFFFSDISIFLRRKCYTRFFFSHISIFPNLYAYMRMPCIALAHGAMSRGFVSHGRCRPLIVTFEQKKCCSSSFELACYSQPVLS